MVQIYIAGSKLLSTKSNVACVCINISLLASCQIEESFRINKVLMGFAIMSRECNAYAEILTKLAGSEIRRLIGSNSTTTIQSPSVMSA